MASVTLRIERGIPSPPPSHGRGNPKYPLAELQVGDSFAVPLTGIQKGGQDIAAWQLRNAASQAGRRLGRRFTCSLEPDGLSIRCWRVV